MNLSFIARASKQFWTEHPALLYALAFLLGIFSTLSWNWSLILPLGLIALPCLFNRDFYRLSLVLGCLTVSFLYVKTLYEFPSLPKEGIFGTAQFAGTSISSASTHFGKRWIYKGTLISFIPDSTIEAQNKNSHARNIPCTISLPQNLEIHRPPADQVYRIHGKLKESTSGYYTLAVSKQEPWYAVASSWGLAEIRFSAKKSVAAYIQENIKNTKSAVFLTGIATGDFDDRLMAFEFSRFGLQHIMAISGFHFAIIAGIMSFILRLIVSKKKAVFILIFLMSSYFLFLGCGPSIMRAWITISIALLSFTMEKNGNGLNSLGLAMFFILLWDPLFCRSIGFQFSFISTAAILMFFSICDNFMQVLLKKRRLSEMVQMDRVDQHGYFILSSCRQAIALGLAVNFAAMPMMFFYFQKFPIMSLLYNIFFPFMVSISMFFLILGIILTIIFPPLGALIHAVNNWYTNFTLDFTYNMPTTLDFVLKIAPFPVELLACYLSLLFFSGLLLKRRDSLQDLAFL